MSMPATAPGSGPDEALRARQIANAKAWTEPGNWDGDTYIGPGMPPWGRAARCPVVRNGRRCRKPCIPGGTVCNAHGGAAPQVKNRAKLRILSLVDPSLGALARTLAQTQDENLRVKVAFGILDRAGMGKAADVSADVAKALLMDRYHAYRAKLEEEQAAEGEEPVDVEWSVTVDPGSSTSSALAQEVTESLAPALEHPAADGNNGHDGHDGHDDDDHQPEQETP